VLRGLNWKVVLAFLDDILVLGKDFEGHLANLRAVLVRFREYGLKKWLVNYITQRPF
jgi:hypothetical protein